MNLLIQGSDIPTTILKIVAKLSSASGIEQITPTAFRLCDAQPAHEIAEVCAGAQLDHAFVPENRLPTDFKLLVMDMDSTLITMETIDELADMVGLKPQVAAITEQAMRGELDFNESLARRVALLKGLDQSALQRVYDERLKLSPGADILLATAKRAGIKLLLVSGGFTYMTERLKPRLGLDYTYSNTLEIVGEKLSGKVIGRIVNADAKRDELLRVRDELGIVREQIAGVGDGANDLKFLADCGTSVAYHAKPIVRAQTNYALNHVGLNGMIHLLGG
jgi:phosphoserine phosphatase